MKLMFQGVVQWGDCCRVSREDLNGSVWVGDHDVVSEVEDARWSGPVTVAIADERFVGDLVVETGYGYSEYTPCESDSLRVGGHDLIGIIQGYEGREITVWIADEPINVLESL